jgi:hypothetical protein
MAMPRAGFGGNGRDRHRVPAEIHDLDFQDRNPGIVIRHSPIGGGRPKTAGMTARHQLSLSLQFECARVRGGHLLRCG